MDTETPKEPTRHGASMLSVFITSLSAAIVVAGGFGIVVEAFIFAAANYFGLGHIFVYAGSAANAAASQRAARPASAIISRPPPSCAFSDHIPCPQALGACTARHAWQADWWR